MKDHILSYRSLALSATGALALMACAGHAAAQDAPIPVADLHASMFAWKDQSVTFGGYPSATKLGSRVWFTSEPEGAIRMANCALSDPSGDTVDREEPIVVRGRYTHFSTATADGKPAMQMKDCEVVSIGEAFDENVPAELGSDQIIPLAALYAATTGWFGTEVTVVGYYSGHTHSSANDQTSVGLKTGQSGRGVVNCHMPGKDVVPDGLADNREGVVVTGKLGRPGANIVKLYDCAFVNR